MSDDIQSQLQEEWSNYQENMFSKIEKLDELIFKLSTSSFALSIAFIKNIAGGSLAINNYKYLIISAWSLFFISIFFHIFSYYYAISLDKKKKDAIGTAIKEDKQDILTNQDSLLYQEDTTTPIYNAVSLWAYIGGLSLILIFAILNLSKGNTMSNQNDTQISTPSRSLPPTKNTDSVPSKSLPPQKQSTPKK